MMLKRTHRSLFAVLMLAALACGTVEAIAGEVLDAREHSEHLTTAAHEHAGPSDTAELAEDPASEGQQVKGYDHCGHQHGSAVRGVGIPEAGVSVLHFHAVADIPRAFPDAPTPVPFHPPKA